MPTPSWQFVGPRFEPLPYAFDRGLRRDGQLAIAPKRTPWLTSVAATKATLIHQAMCQSAAATPITVNKTLTDRIE